jgi:outer membrane lipoprotein-sorting protein
VSRTWHRRPARILVPLLALAVAGTAVAVVLSGGSPDRRLPVVSASQLIGAIRQTHLSGFSGTILAQMSLGLPDADPMRAPDSALMPMAGAHTLRYWYGGPELERVALLEPTSETDVFRSGSQVWQWNSSTHVAIHSVLAPAVSADLGAPIAAAPLTFAAITPQELGERAVAAAGEATSATVADGPSIADRATYALTLTPDASVPTRIGHVRISVDAQEKVPLGVQVYARGDDEPAIDVSFTSITFKRPADAYFTFAPPAGATVRRGMQPQLVTAGQSADSPALMQLPSGGWAAVSEYRTPTAPVLRSLGTTDRVRQVTGLWGRATLVDTPLLCLLVTEDGRIFAGAVDPPLLYAAAAG